ncbi:MAG: hypothetical protein ACOY90_01280 [Candidatus Zhuqueibacterota bacterium]
MKHFPLTSLLFMTFLAAASLLFAQESTPASVDTTSGNGLVRIFLDCDFCDHSYIKTNIPFVNFTRDARQAQIHILITSQSTASGGHRYTLDFIGRENFTGMDHKLTYVSEQSDTDDLRRKGLTHTLKMGLMPYVAQTPVSPNIKISYDDEKSPNLQSRTGDPWDFWVFHISLSGDVQAEKSQNEFVLYSSVSAERITEDWKFESDFDYQFEQQSFTDDGEKIESSLNNSELTALLVKSLSSHWSLGFHSEYMHSTYTNLDRQFSLAPAVEYNFYPWKLSNRKVFTVAYYLGYRYIDYINETLYDKFSEQSLLHYLETQVEFIQPWGELDVMVNFLQYFHQPNFYRVESEFDVSFRITKGLSFYVESNFESIHDQLYLPKGDAALEDILLKRRRLATNYDISFQLGIVYTFGSIYNNIVNHRF